MVSNYMIRREVMQQGMSDIAGCQAARQYLDCLVMMSRGAPPLLKRLLQMLPCSRLCDCMTSDPP